MASILSLLFPCCLSRPKKLQGPREDEDNDDPVVDPDDTTWLLNQPQPTYGEIDPTVKSEMDALRSIVRDAEHKMLNITDVQPFLFSKEAPYKPIIPSNNSSRSSSPCASVFCYETENYSYNDRIAPPPPTRRNSATQQPSHHSHSHRHNHRGNHHHYYSHSRSTSRTRRGSASLSYYDEEEGEDEDEDDEYPITLRRTPKLNVKLVSVPIGGIRAAVAAANEKAKKKKKQQNEAAKMTPGSGSGFVIGSSGSGRQKEKKKIGEDNLPDVKELSDKDRETIIAWSDRIWQSMDRSFKYPEPYPTLVRHWGS